MLLLIRLLKSQLLLGRPKKSSGAAWHQMLSASIKDIGFTRSKGDPDLYSKPQVKPDGSKYY